MAALNLNTVILCGRLTSDPELRTTQNGVAVTSFTVAVNRPRQKDKEQEADFINCVAWRQTAEFVAKFFHRGNSICVTGSIGTRHYMTDSGEKRYITEVVVDNAKFVDSKADSQAQAPAAYVPEAYASGASFEEVKGDDELPF